MHNLRQLQEIAEDIGFDAVGVASLSAVDDAQKEVYDRWISSGHQGGMSYLERNLPLRYDPRLGDAILEGAQSVVVVAASYYPERLQADDAPQISKYAYGADYHIVLRDKLIELGHALDEKFETHAFRPIVDTVPFMERYWAQKAGLGFIGRNRNLILKGKGSFFFLGEMLTTMAFEVEEFEPKAPGAYCGSCSRCIDNCPTQALTKEGLDARKCVSYLTIEHRGDISPELGRLLGKRLYGCDTCQDVCPFNHKPPISKLFMPRKEVLGLTEEDLADFTRERYKTLVKASALERARYDQMKRNAELYLANKEPLNRK